MNPLQRLFPKHSPKQAAWMPPRPLGDAVVGMITDKERAWLRNYAATRYTAAGAIVDLGCFVGSSTIALADGLRDNRKHPDAKVHAYDRFLWNEFLRTWWSKRGFPTPQLSGDSLLPEFLRRTSPWKDQIIVHKEDLNIARWDKTPIEFLFVDAMKSPELAEAITRAFFPYLISGFSFVAHQDFAHFWTSWIHLLQFKLRNCFEVVAEVPKSSTVVFRCLKTPTADDLNLLSLSDSTFSEIEAAFDYSLGVVSADQKPSIMAAKAMAYIHRGDLERADEVVGAIDAGRSRGRQLEAVRTILEQRLA
jgi:hypothetical protein